MTDVLAELATVFPALSRFAAAGATVVPHPRYRSQRAVRELLEQLASTQPVVLVLDDFHWADAASIGPGGRAAAPAGPRSTCSWCWGIEAPAAAGAGWPSALERAHRDGGPVTGIELGALSRDEARELLGAARRGIRSSTGALRRERRRPVLSRAARPRAAAAAASSAAARRRRPFATCRRVAGALREELSLLSDAGAPGARRGGGGGRPVRARAGRGRRPSRAAALDALDALLRPRLVRATDVPRRFRFRHPIVRRAVYEATPAGWRLAAHERCAEALAARGARGARAHHVERPRARGRGGGRGLREAGEAAAQRAPATRPPGSTPRSGSCPRRPRRRACRAAARARQALAAAGRSPRATRAAREPPAGPEESTALRPLTTACAGVEHLLGQHEQAHARLISASTACRTRHRRGGRADDRAGDGRFYRMDYRWMSRVGREGGDRRARLGDPPLATAAAAVAGVRGRRHGATHGRVAHAEAAALVADLSDDELARASTPPATRRRRALPRPLPRGGRARRAGADGRPGDRAERAVPLAYSILGQVRLLRGRLSEAAELLDNAVEGARLSGNVQALAGNLVNRSLTAVAAGDLDLALSTAQENAELTEGLDQSLICAAGVALATALLETGAAGRAVDALLSSSGGDELPLIPGVWRARSLELLTRCWLASGRQPEAARAASLAQRTAERLTLRVARSMADRAHAAVALAVGRPDAAAQHALASVAAADEVGMPVDAALSRILAGRALAQAGQPERAVTELQRAADDLHACGALRYRAAAESELRKLGRHIARRTKPGNRHGSGIESLTSREREIAQLVVDRRTNREIAETLFLSPKTVETHLRTLFHKLDVSSRDEVARAVERSGTPKRV